MDGDSRKRFELDPEDEIVYTIPDQMEAGICV